MTISPVLHRAPWLLPMTGPPVADGAVLTEGGTIRAAGPWSGLAASAATVIEHPDHVLMPGLVNAHIHLELSHLSHLSRCEVSSFTDWIVDLMAERGRLGFTGERVVRAARRVLEQQWTDGVLVLADIGNTDIGRGLAGEFAGLILPFLEWLGLKPGAVRDGLKRLADLDPQVFCTGHAPYSTHHELLRALKERANHQRVPFPIHVAEPPAERELLMRGQGEMERFLRQRDFYDPGFRPPGIDIQGSVQYLHALGILDRGTLCVHGIHVSPEEMRLLSTCQASVCLCPGSNRFLGVGRAPVTDYLRHRVNLALGTDSAASNPDVSLWSEMALLFQDHPDIDPLDILTMATAGGARALGIGDRYGCLAPGHKARFIRVAVSGCTHESDLCRNLVLGQGRGAVEWIDDTGGKETSWPA